MKAIKFFAICAFAMVCSLNLNAAEPQLVYNDVVENGKVTGKMVYAMDNEQHLTPVNNMSSLMMVLLLPARKACIGMKLQRYGKIVSCLQLIIQPKIVPTLFGLRNRTNL